jgi:hypothetical protein
MSGGSYAPRLSYARAATVCPPPRVPAPWPP